MEVKKSYIPSGFATKRYFSSRKEAAKAAEELAWKLFEDCVLKKAHDAVLAGKTRSQAALLKRKFQRLLKIGDLVTYTSRVAKAFEAYKRKTSEVEESSFSEEESFTQLFSEEES